MKGALWTLNSSVFGEYITSKKMSDITLKMVSKSSMLCLVSHWRLVRTKVGLTPV
jgi:hypothetical protein